MRAIPSTLLLTAFSSLCVLHSQSQPVLGQPWSMEQCINYAWDHNIQIKQAEISQKIAKNNVTESKANLLPSVNGFASHTYNYGLTINPFTNTFANSEVTADNFALSGSLTLFSGLQNINTIKQNQYSYQASTYDLQYSKNNIALNIAQNYLQILLNKELLVEATNQQSVSSEQVDRTKKLVDAGSLAKSNLLDVESQEANDEVNVVNAQTQLDLSTLALAQLLDLDSAQMVNIVSPEINIPDNGNLDEPEKIYTKALTTQPDVQSSELKWESSERSQAISRGALFPKLTMTGTIGTGFSTANTEVIGQNTTIDTIHTTITGVDVLYPNYSYVTRMIPYGKQLDNNRNESFGFRLTIPIFNGLQSSIAYQNSKLNEQNAYYSYQLTQLNLRKTIQQAYADALAALKKYHAVQKSVVALQESFNYAQSKFDVGMATALDYNTAKTNLAKAQSDLLQAKYNYVFKVKVLDFYEGKPLKL
jgi:outer membrane protein